MAQVDQELVNIYKRDCLWKDDRFYISILEEALLDSFRGELTYDVMKSIHSWKKIRVGTALEKTFDKDGSVTVRLEDYIPPKKDINAWVSNLLNSLRTLVRVWQK